MKEKLTKRPLKIGHVFPSESLLVLCARTQRVWKWNFSSLIFKVSTILEHNGKEWPSNFTSLSDLELSLPCCTKFNTFNFSDSLIEWMKTALEKSMERKGAWARHWEENLQNHQSYAPAVFRNNRLINHKMRMKSNKKKLISLMQ